MPNGSAAMTQIQRLYRQARDKSVPLVVMRTVDAAACVRAIEPVTRDERDRPAPIVQWNSVSGFEPVNPASATVARNLGGGAIINPMEALVKAQGVPSATTVVFQNLSDWWTDARVRQAFWNLRDPFKKDWRMAVVMGPDGAVPHILEHDVLIIDEPLPGSDELAEIVRAQYQAANLRVQPTEEDIRRGVDAVAGLSAFAAEQAVALSLRARGLDFNALRDRHRQMIENTKGLSVWTGGETFDQVGGLKAFIEFARRFISAGRYRPGAVLFVDEIEKALAGIRGDLTGISQDYLAALLSYMQDGHIPGILLMGHPGTGKSLLAKAFGNTISVPTIRFDMGAMHGSLVGESQHALRHALKIGTAVSQGRPIVIATCNSVAVLPPELVNRFKWRFFVDLPDDEEKKTIWPIHLKKFGLDLTQPRPDDTEWNGREIEQCCENAWQLKMSVIEAGETVIPISQSAAVEIERRRTEAAGRYLSASVKGPYLHDPRPTVRVGNRQIRVEDDQPKGWMAPGSVKPN